MVELDQLRILEERIRRQKSRVNWLQEGDRNTIYFHRKRRSNYINPAMVGFSEEASVSDIELVAIEVFRNQFASGKPIHVESQDVRFLHLLQKETN